jgi:hypothetical protein
MTMWPDEPLPDGPMEWLAKNIPRRAPSAIDRLAAVTDQGAADRVREYDEFPQRVKEMVAEAEETPGPDVIAGPSVERFLRTIAERLRPDG